MQQALLLFVIFQSLLFSIILISGRKPENKYLVIYFVYLFLFHFSFLLTNVECLTDFFNEEFIRISYEFVALSNSAIVFMFLYSILEKPLPKPFYLLWLLPVLHTIADLTFKTCKPDLYEAGFYNNWYLNFPLYAKIIFTLLLIRQVKIFKKEINERGLLRNHHQLIKLYWGKYFVYFHVALSTLLLLYMLFTLANGRLYKIDSSLFVYSVDYYNLINRTCMIFFLLVFGYLALRNPAVFNSLSTNSAGFHLEQQIAEIVLPEEEKNFQANIEFTDEQTSQYTELLNKLMEEQQIYLDPTLSLNQLAQHLAIPSRKLSQFLQLVFNKKFKEYINNYRVEYAKKLLTLPNSTRTMYSIAYDSGFNAESTFYLVFKQHAGVTPKQYQDKFKNATRDN